MKQRYNQKYKSHFDDLQISRFMILNVSLAKYSGLDSISSGRGHTEDRAITVLVATTVPIKVTEFIGQLKEQQPFHKDSSLRSWFVSETLYLKI